MEVDDTGRGSQPLPTRAGGSQLATKMRMAYHGTFKLRGITDPVDLWELVLPSPGGTLNPTTACPHLP